MKHQNVVEFLQNKYAETGSDTVADWMRKNNVDLSLQSCTTVIHRGECKGVQVMLTLAACLKCTKDELRWVAQEMGDNTLWRYITAGEFTPAEHDLIEAYRKLSDKQREIVDGMIREMASHG